MGITGGADGSLHRGGIRHVAVDLEAVFTGESAAVDDDGNVTDLVVGNLKTLQVIHRSGQQRVHHCRGIGTLDGVHIHLTGHIPVVDIAVALMRIHPAHHLGCIEG